MFDISQSEFSTCLYEAFHRNGIDGLLNEERADAFYRLTAHMLEVNEQFNLTAIKDWKKVILLHYADSLKGAEVIPEGARVIDVGCGAGFPSLPLALCRPDLTVLAIDSTAKRIGYVNETACLLGLRNLTARASRAEELARDTAMRERFDCATARAVAALPILCELCLPFVKQGGIFAAMKGKSAKEELTAAKNAIKRLGGSDAVLYDTPLKDEKGELYAHATVVIAKTAPTPSAYPRVYAKIAKAPL